MNATSTATQPLAPPIPLHPALPDPAGVGLRAGGYLIDLLPALVLALPSLIPIIGWMATGFLTLPYWLLRDIRAASLGKLAVRTRVVMKDGSPALAKALILRNLPLALAPAFLILPVIGPFLAGPCGFIVIATETIFMFTQGERVGDRIAGTKVMQLQSGATR